MIIVQIIEGKDKGFKFESENSVIRVGRDETNEVCVDDVHVSSFHGTFKKEGGKWLYEDLNSTNGSAILRGGKKIPLGREGESNEIEIQEGDIILIGSASKPVAIGVSFGEEAKSVEPSATVSSIAKIDDIERFRDIVRGDAGALNRLYNVICKLKWELSLQEVIESVQSTVFELLPGATHLALALYDHTSKAFIPMLCAERGMGELRETFQISQTILNRVVEEKAAVLVADAPTEVGETESILGANILSTMAAPLWKGGEIIGILQVDNRKSSGVFLAQDLQMFLLFASQLSLAVQNSILYEKLKVAETKLERENRFLKEEKAKALQTFVRAQSKAMGEVYEKCEKVKNTRVSILLEGETGTGKEVIASMIHYSSNRKDKLFVAVNCAAMPATLLESELFGHKKGAFTGADRDKKGLFEVADGGTLFLDEVTEMNISVQGKLLRALQEGEVRPLGSTSSRKVDVRVIAATNKDLKKQVEEGKFREDLFYRLNVFPIRVPPLKERREDIPPLIKFFIQKYTGEFGKVIGGISQPAMDALVAYDWPGNIRELENEIQRVVLIADPGQVITMEHLSTHIRKIEKLIEEVGPKQGTLKARMEEVEKWILLNALKENNGNKSMTAKALGISREGLHKKLAKYGI